MHRTQVQIPDDLFREAKRIAREREISFAEVVRRGLEYITRVYPPTGETKQAWSPPAPRHLGTFLAPAGEWRLLAQEHGEHRD